MASGNDPTTNLSRIADRLALAAQAGFIGRAQECESFRTALAAGGTPAVRRCRSRRRRKDDAPARVRANGRRAAGPSSHLTRVTCVRRSEACCKPLPMRSAVTFRRPPYSSAGSRCRLHRHLRTPAALDSWLRDTIAPSLPQGVLVVLGGRDTPAREWSSDIAWSPLTGSSSCGTSPGETAAFLTSRGVADAVHAAVLDFTHGHPLALSLVADVISSSTRVPGSIRSRPRTSSVISRSVHRHGAGRLPRRARRRRHRACHDRAAAHRSVGRTKATRVRVAALAAFVESSAAGCFRTTSRVKC